MKISFIDTIKFDYDIDYPLNHPLGAGNSAICYLAKELAKLGNDVTVFNSCSVPSVAHGVSVRNIEELQGPAEFLNGQDIAVVCSGAVGFNLRQSGVTVPMVLWTQHAVDQPAMQALRDPRERYAWTAFAYVSKWQKKLYEDVFGCPPDRGMILPNGVSTAFETVVHRYPWYVEGRPPVLFYTSTPFRGLQTLLSAFPAIRRQTGASLRVYSSMKVYQKPDHEDDFGCLYEMCRLTDGIEYHGSLGQRELAGAIANADALAYPSTFAEGLCVAMLEAMAVGAEVFTTALGALPESSGGHACMIPVTEGLAHRFAEMVVKGIQECERDPDAALKRRAKRVAYIADKFVWHKIAKEWNVWLETLASRRSTPTAVLKTASA